MQEDKASSEKENNDMGQPNKQSAGADVSAARRISKVWFIPIVAILIGFWMVYQTTTNRGPLIKIHFETAEGLAVGTSKIKLREVTVGKITEVKLNSTFDGIEITARLDKGTEKLLKTDTAFWVVKPRIGKGGISGLTTILSGAYIEMSAGIEDDERSDFVGLENPPVTPFGKPGIRITLDSDDETGLDIGDPIIFRGIEVGRVEYQFFNIEERIVYYDAFIESPYDKLVTTNTRFWKIKGVEVKLSADGIKVNTGTLETMIGGGVTFGVPDNQPKGDIITQRAFFTIYDDKDEVLEAQFKHAQEFAMLFGHSIRGLRVGAPVEYKGVRIGTVKRTDIDYPEIDNFLDQKTRIPVIIQIEPARLGMKDDENKISLVKESIEKMIQQGLHGFMRSGSLLTGSKYIEIDYVPNTKSHSQKFSGYQIIPTAASEIDGLVQKVDSILATIDKLSLDSLVDNASGAMFEMKKAMVNFDKASAQVDSLLDTTESNELIANVNLTLRSFEKLAQDFSEGSTTHQELQNMILTMETMLKELTPVLSQLNHQPNSLIFSGKKSDELVPKGKSNE